MTGIVERYYSEGNGMIWFKDTNYMGQPDVNWIGPPPANEPGSTGLGITDNGLGILNAYENYLNGKKYIGNSLSQSQQKFNNVIDEMLGPAKHH